MIRHPQVTDAVVVGVPDELLGEVVGCVVEAPAVVSAEAVLEVAASILPTYAVPTIVRLVDQLPRSSAGKAKAEVIPRPAQHRRPLIGLGRRGPTMQSDRNLRAGFGLRRLWNTRFMADGDQQRRPVVKRVVRRSAPPPSSPRGQPAVRYGRPVAPATAAPRAKVASRPARPPKEPRPPREVRRKAGSATRKAGSAGTRAFAAAARAVAGVGQATGSAVGRRTRRVLGWRIPDVDPMPAAVTAGLLAGLLSVGLGAAALAMFTEVRGVSSGGGRWGTLTFVVIAFVAFAAGELLLSAFGSTHARLTSFLGVVLTILALLGLFLDVADSGWGLVLVPLLMSVAYAAARALIDVAERNVAAD